jgi:hypothetical protein
MKDRRSVLSTIAGAAAMGSVCFRPNQADAQVLAQAFLQIPYEAQQTSEWCWVASAKMVASYFNINTPSQCEMLERAYGAPCCENPGLCTVPGSIFQVQQLIQGFGLQTSQLGRPANGYVLLNLFQNNHPVVIHLVQGHFSVLSGIQVVATPQGPLGMVHVLDPFYGEQDVSLPVLYQSWDLAVYVS